MQPDTGFPDLRIIRAEDLYLHEEVDLERVAKLLDRLSADGQLRNPPVVATYRAANSEKYLLLDGANRVSALANLEIPHLLIQAEPLEASTLRLSHWNHVVRDIEAERFLDEAASLSGVRISDGSRDGNGYLCTVVLRDGTRKQLLGSADLVERVRSLRELSRIYHRGDARMDRVTHENVESLHEQHPHFGALVIYPEFTKDEVRALCEQNERLPSGITRFLVPRRVLGFNLQLALLKSNIPLEDKRRWLAEAIRQKVSEHKVRFYQEPTIVFDD